MLRDLSSSQRELAEYMSSLSELIYSAGWIEGLEYVLWQAVSEGHLARGSLSLTREQIGRLQELSSRCGGWIRFDSEREEAFVPFTEWKQIVEGR